MLNVNIRLIHKLYEGGDIQPLLDEGADPNNWFTGDECGECNPIHVAARIGSLDGVKKLLACKVNVNSTDESGSTPLSHCAYYGHKDIACMLLENGADIEAKDVNQMTPLHIAAMTGRFEMVKLLLEKGCRISPLDKKHMAPFDYAMIDKEYFGRNYDIIGFLYCWIKEKNLI